MYSDKPCSICKVTKEILEFDGSALCAECFPLVSDGISDEAISKALLAVTHAIAKNKYSNFN